MYPSAGPGSGGFALGDARAVGFTAVLPLAVLSGISGGSRSSLERLRVVRAGGLWVIRYSVSVSLCEKFPL